MRLPVHPAMRGRAARFIRTRVYTRAAAPRVDIRRALCSLGCMADLVLLSGVEAANLLRVSQRTLEGWRVRGGGPPYVRLGRQVRYSEADLIAWINAHRFGSTSEASLAAAG